MSQGRFRRTPGGVCSLGLHLVWCPKDRRGVLGGRVAARCGELLELIADEHDWEIVANEVMPDHVHLFVRVGPTDAPAQVVRAFKGRTARILDVIVLPYGDDYLMGGEEPSDCVSLLTLMGGPPRDTMPVLSHGSGGARTDLVCGHLHSDDPLFDPTMRALPAVFVVRVPDGPAAHWVSSSINYALAVTTDSLPSPPQSMRLPELLLTEVLRLHLATAPMAEHGWIAALHDPILGPAMAQLHTAPERKWTVTELANAVAVSRSVLDQRFRDVLGRSPIRYLTEWRMHLADDLLASTQLGVASTARRIGYESEESFSRAFRRTHGIPPGAWRAGHTHRVTSR